MSGSVAIVGAGQIGHAVAGAYAARGWQVTLHARSRPEWSVPGAHFAPYSKGRDPAPQADVVVDTIAFDAEDVDRYDPRKVGRLIAISSASVYCDEDGRTLDEAARGGFPRLPDPIRESQNVVAPGPETYSTRKVRMETAAQARFGPRATILRPCAIHGPWSRHPREWWFVKRLLDRRTAIPLAREGRSRFQTTSARKIGEAACEAGTRDLGGTFNLADRDSPTVHEIGLAIAQAMGASTQFVLCKDATPQPVGRTPWSIPAPFVLSSEAAWTAFDLSAQPFALAVEPAVEWLAERRPDDWRTDFPQLAAYPWDLFNYEAEDRYLLESA